MKPKYSYAFMSGMEAKTIIVSRIRHVLLIGSLSKLLVHCSQPQPLMTAVHDRHSFTHYRSYRNKLLSRKQTPYYPTLFLDIFVSNWLIILPACSQTCSQIILLYFFNPTFDLYFRSDDNKMKMIKYLKGEKSRIRYKLAKWNGCHH